MITHNNLGKPIHSTDEGILNFHQWFDNSKLTDEQGRPKVFYHGTWNNKINSFKPTASKRTGFMGSNREVISPVHFFTEDRDMAWDFANNRAEDKKYNGTREEKDIVKPTVIPVYLKAHSILDLTKSDSTSKLKKLGITLDDNTLSDKYLMLDNAEHVDKIKKHYDAVLLKENIKKGGRSIAILHSNNIKHINNKGGFNSSNMLYESVIKVGNIEKEVVHQPNFSYSYDENDNKQYNELVNVNVNKFDELFKKSDYYIGHQGKGQIKNRYENFGHWFNLSKDSLHAPYVSFNDKEPEFTNGRHRYAWLRDNGVKTIPMTMNKVDKEKAIKFGLVD